MGFPVRVGPTAGTKARILALAPHDQPREFSMKSFLVAALSATAILGFATATPAAAQATVTGAPKGTAPVGDEWRVF